MDDFDRVVWRACVVVTLVSVLLVIFWMVRAYSTVGDPCLYGEGGAEASVSWWPPGKACTIDGAYTIKPSYLRYYVFIIAVIGLPLSVFLRRSLRHR